MARTGQPLRVGKLPRGLADPDASGTSRTEQRRREAMPAFEEQMRRARQTGNGDDQRARMAAVLGAARDFLGKTFARQVARRSS